MIDILPYIQSLLAKCLHWTHCSVFSNVLPKRVMIGGVNEPSTVNKSFITVIVP